MKKPERKILELCSPIDMGEIYKNHQKIGYNQACDDWEKYHKWAMDKLRKRLLPETLKQEILLHQEKAKEQYQQKWDIINGLPSVEEIEEILVGLAKIIPDTVEKYGDYWYWLAKAIHKRIRGEG